MKQSRIQRVKYDLIDIWRHLINPRTMGSVITVFIVLAIATTMIVFLMIPMILAAICFGHVIVGLLIGVSIQDPNGYIYVFISTSWAVYTKVFPGVFVLVFMWILLKNWPYYRMLDTDY